ncbi:hypothetical protein HHK36_013577 [Tetracentron sinense]|uniref:Ubiquitin-like protease family profile domain-containing protein n=1 Tax=Tetracentron sinense TaxID=13715 RepID=A0A834Z4D5_TETSI|nr:hypothetical protein HHK36_013577 [Tetracentron sinense]
MEGRDEGAMFLEDQSKVEMRSWTQSRILPYDVSTNLDERVEKELARRELHDTQMPCVIEDLRQKIATQDTIIETLREQLSKKETSTENEFNKRSVHELIYVSESLVKQDEAFVYRAAFKTLESGGLLDDMVIDAYMCILDIQQRESGPSHQKRTYYWSSHLHQFMRKCVMERKFSFGVPIRRNSAGFDIYESDRVFIPVNRSGVHWFLVEVDLLCRKVTILDSMMPRRTDQIAPEICTLVDIEAYRDKIVVSLLLSPLNREEEDSSSWCVTWNGGLGAKEEEDLSSWCVAWNGGLGAKVQWRKT